MRSMPKLFVIIGGSALLLLCVLFGAFFAGPLIASAHSAQNATKPATTSTAKNNPYCDFYNQTLAKSLNVSTTALQQDRVNAYNTTINQLVKDGKLTQAQATTMEQNRAKNQACKSFNAQGVEVRAVQRYLLSQKTALASSIAQGLHTTSSDLIAQLQSGKTLTQIAKTQNISKATLATLIKTTVTNQVNSGVASGALTKDQATAFQQYATNHPSLFARLAVRHGHAKKAK